MNAVIAGREAARGWVKVFRDPPFYLVGVLPFTLGAGLAVNGGARLHWGIYAMGALAVALIMAMTFLVNEYHDYETDRLNTGYNKFSGGSRSLPRGLVPREKVAAAAWICAALAALLGLVIQFGYHTGWFTVPLGAAAMAIGWAYTAPPFRLIYRGLGELFIGFSVGWMPVFVSYYLLAGMPSGPRLHLVALPIMLSIVMVIIINEFPDYDSDRASGKNNFVARFGPARGIWLYEILAVLTVGSLSYLGLACFHGWRAAALAVPCVIGLAVLGMALAGAWRKRAPLEKLCLVTILLNLVSIVALILVVAL